MELETYWEDEVEVIDPELIAAIEEDIIKGKKFLSDQALDETLW